MGGLGETDGPGLTAAAAGFDAGVCLREQLAEAIASLRWQTAVMLSHAPGRTTGPEGESSPGSQSRGSKPGS
ncbi:uncharacterized protein SAZU_4603 [Streptomyces azureus]|uniref:Uncharacterized protein n=1 Tax=Streptomyces azureus TaxID=146537 RepID=A0A0K8PPF9_STRAJ|nr:uncharacterized protein SAZU_4603 [Streptomyces azureus]